MEKERESQRLVRAAGHINHISNGAWMSCRLLRINKGSALKASTPPIQCYDESINGNHICDLILCSKIFGLF